jgi:hypothetical protein
MAARGMGAVAIQLDDKPAWSRTASRMDASTNGAMSSNVRTAVAIGIGPTLHVGGDEVSAAVQDGVIRLWVPTNRHGVLDRPAIHALEAPQGGRRQV